MGINIKRIFSRWIKVKCKYITGKYNPDTGLVFYRRRNLGDLFHKSQFQQFQQLKYVRWTKYWVKKHSLSSSQLSIECLVNSFDFKTSCFFTEENPYVVSIKDWWRIYFVSPPATASHFLSMRNWLIIWCIRAIMGDAPCCSWDHTLLTKITIIPDYILSRSHWVQYCKHFLWSVIQICTWEH